VTVGVRVGVPGSDEDVVNPAPVAGLADDGCAALGLREQAL
jgi:hypothetical protein